LSFNKNDSVFWVNGGMFYLVESFQRFFGEIAEEFLGAQLRSDSFQRRADR